MKISDIRADGSTQPREFINTDIVVEYVEALNDGANFPPVTVFHDGAVNWLADGFHRLAAYKATNREEIPAEVIHGTKDDAIDYACSAIPNARHGLREKPGDRHRRVATMLQNHPDWSNVEISKHCGVSEGTVRNVKKTIFVNYEDTQFPTERTVTRNGTTYTQNTERIGKTAAPAENQAERFMTAIVDIGDMAPEAHVLGTRVIGALKRMRELASHEPTEVSAGLHAYEREQVRANIRAVAKWLDRLDNAIQGDQ